MPNSMKGNNLLKLLALLFILIFSIEVCRADNSLAEKLFKEGGKYYQNKKYSMAIDKFRKFVMNFPAHEKAPQAYLFLGRSYYELEKTDLALSRYKMILSTILLIFITNRENSRLPRRNLLNSQ